MTIFAVDAMDNKIRKIIEMLHGELAELYGQRLSKLVLFGSHARGDMAPGSDIDILIVLQGAVIPGEEISRAGEITSRLSLESDTVISCAFVSEDAYVAERNPLIINVRREGVEV